MLVKCSRVSIERKIINRVGRETRHFTAIAIAASSPFSSMSPGKIASSMKTLLTTTMYCMVCWDENQTEVIKDLKLELVYIGH